MKAIRQRYFEILILKNCFCDESSISSQTSKVPLVMAVVVEILSQLSTRFEDLVREYWMSDFARSRVKRTLL